MPADWSRAAVWISPIMALTSCTEPTISAMVRPASSASFPPADAFCTEAPIRLEISRAAWAERWASPRTSVATTAKPRPCSPARAASTAALSARILVWNAMESMTPVMSAMRAEPSLISRMVLTTWPTTSPPRCATLAAETANVLARSDAVAVCPTVPVSCSMLADVA
ncbi:hypothetical protein D3C71_1499020 [compost metagenome]